MRELEAAVREKAEAADAIYPPMSAELDLFGGLLSAYGDDAAGVAAALARAKDKPAVRDFPTLAQLQQVVLAEQDRLAGKPEAALSRLRPIAGRDDALVVVHWALERSARAAGDTRIAQAEARWLETHPGRAAAESTTADVLRFVNVSMSAQARKSPVRPEKPAGATTAGRPLKNVPAA
jgi:hypothetical protein